MPTVSDKPATGRVFLTFMFPFIFFLKFFMSMSLLNLLTHDTRCGDESMESAATPDISTAPASLTCGDESTCFHQLELECMTLILELFCALVLSLW